MRSKRSKKPPKAIVRYVVEIEGEELKRFDHPDDAREFLDAFNGEIERRFNEINEVRS